MNPMGVYTRGPVVVVYRHKGTVVAVYELKGPPCTHFSNLILNDFTLQGISLCYTSDWSAHG